VGAPQVDDAEQAEDDIGQPRAEPGAEDAIPAESLARLYAAIKDEADQHTETESIGAPTAAGIGCKWGSKAENHDTGEGKGNLQIQIDQVACDILAI